MPDQSVASCLILALLGLWTLPLRVQQGSVESDRAALVALSADPLPHPPGAADPGPAQGGGPARVAGTG